MPTWSNGISLKGAPGAPGQTSPGLRSGTGAPSASNPSIQVDGDFYIRTDVLPNLMFGPRAGGVWPAQGVAVNGGVILSGNGPPQANVGSVGDVYYDLSNALFYPGKTLQGWVTTPISIVGPTGPSIQAQPQLGTYVSCTGPGVQINGVTTSATPQVMSASGTTLPGYFAPLTPSAFMGACVVSYSNSVSALTFTLYDVTAGAAVYSTSAAKGTVNTVGPFDASAYPMVQGHTYQWQVTGAGAGYATLAPQYLMPSSSQVSVSGYPSFYLPATTLSTTALIMQAPNAAGNTQYYRKPLGSYLYSVQATVVGTGTATAQFSTVFNTGAMAASPAGVNYTFGPFGVSTAYLAANTNHTWSVTGSGSASVYITINTVQ